MLAATLLLAAFLVLLQLPAAVSPLWLPWLGAAWGLLFPAALLLQADMPLPELPAEAQRLFPDSGYQVEAQRMQANRQATWKTPILSIREKGHGIFSDAGSRCTC